MTSIKDQLIKEKALNVELLAALKLAKRMNDEALPKFNWGASFLDADAITILNETPNAINRAIAKAEAQS